MRHCVIQFFSSPEGYQWKNTLTTILDCYKETPEIYLNPQIAIWGDRLDNLARVPLNTRNQFKLMYLYCKKSYLLQRYFYFYNQYIYFYREVYSRLYCCLSLLLLSWLYVWFVLKAVYTSVGNGFSLFVMLISADGYFLDSIVKI